MHAALQTCMFSLWQLQGSCMMWSKWLKDQIKSLAIFLYFLGFWLKINIFTCMQLMLITSCYVRTSATQWPSFPISLVLLVSFLPHFQFPVPDLKKALLWPPVPPVCSVPIPVPDPISFPPLSVSPVPPLSGPEHPAGTCTQNSRTAGWGPCPDPSVLSKHSSESYEQMKRFHAAWEYWKWQVKLG